MSSSIYIGIYWPGWSNQYGLCYSTRTIWQFVHSSSTKHAYRSLVYTFWCLWRAKTKEVLLRGSLMAEQVTFVKTFPCVVSCSLKAWLNGYSKWQYPLSFAAFYEHKLNSDKQQCDNKITTNKEPRQMGMILDFLIPNAIPIFIWKLSLFVWIKKLSACIYD